MIRPKSGMWIVSSDSANGCVIANPARVKAMHPHLDLDVEVRPAGWRRRGKG
jgi:hypothetical protein